MSPSLVSSQIASEMHSVEYSSSGSATSSGFSLLPSHSRNFGQSAAELPTRKHSAPSGRSTPQNFVGSGLSGSECSLM